MLIANWTQLTDTLTNCVTRYNKANSFLAVAWISSNFVNVNNIISCNKDERMEIEKSLDNLISRQHIRTIYQAKE